MCPVGEVKVVLRVCDSTYRDLLLLVCSPLSLFPRSFVSRTGELLAKEYFNCISSKKIATWSRILFLLTLLIRLRCHPRLTRELMEFGTWFQARPNAHYILPLIRIVTAMHLVLLLCSVDQQSASYYINIKSVLTILILFE